MQSRLEQLLDFYRNDPSDPFIIYGIALEYQNFDITHAEFYFNELLNKFPDYLPTYYHAAKFYESNKNSVKAKELYRKGIDLAKAKNDFHALRELNNALNMLLDEEED